MSERRGERFGKES